MRLHCPHCGTISSVRTSEKMSPTVTWMYMQCGSLECGHNWRVDAEATVTLSPASRPDPRVILPLSPYVARESIRDQMDRAPAGTQEPLGAGRMTLFDGLPAIAPDG
jgi:hypothetical protein